MPHRTVTLDDGDESMVLWFCSDTCHQRCMGSEYQGWNGGWDNEDTYHCADCGRVLVGGQDTEACECQRALRGMCLERTVEGQRCGHGRWLQLPRRLCDGYRRAVARGDESVRGEQDIEGALFACGCDVCSGSLRPCSCESCVEHRSFVVNEALAEALQVARTGERIVVHFATIDEALGIMARFMEDDHSPIPRPTVSSALAFIRAWSG